MRQRYAPSEDWVSDWGMAVTHLEEALAHDAHDTRITTVRQLLSEGRVQLWVGKHSAAIVEPDEGLLQVWLAGGELGELRDMMQDLAQWGKIRQFRKIVVYGRKGWQRTLKMRHKWTVLEKDLWAE